MASRNASSASSIKSTTRTSLNSSTTKATSAKPNNAKATPVRDLKPSAKINPKTIDPFDKKKGKSTFAKVYQNGGIPCRLMHGSVKHKLQWTTPPELLGFDPLLVTFAEGLKETVHPYSFVAHEGFIQLLAVEDAEAKTLPLLSQLIAPFKAALISDDDKCFERTLEALVQLSNVVGPSFNVHLKNVLPQISRKLMKKNYKEHVIGALQKIECNGGSEATSIIKSRVPTYSSVL